MEPDRGGEWLCGVSRLYVSNSHFIDGGECSHYEDVSVPGTITIDASQIVVGSIMADQIVAGSIGVDRIMVADNVAEQLIQDVREAQLVGALTSEQIEQLNSHTLVGGLRVTNEPVPIAPRITAAHRLTGVRRIRDRARVLFLVYMELDIQQQGMATEVMPVEVMYDHHGNLNDQRLYYVPQSLGVGEVYRITRATRERLDGEFVEL
jgi:hypothetical protein